MPITFDEKQKAINPGKLKISLVKYFTYYKQRNTKILIILLIIIASSYFFHHLILLLLIFLLRSTLFHIHNVKELFFQGAIVPAMLFDKENGLIAVYSDMSRDPEKSYPVVMVQPEQFESLRDEDLEEGSLFPAVLMNILDKSDPQSDQWLDFFTVAVPCFVSNNEEIKRAYDSIKPEAWKALKEGTEKLEGKEANMYPVIIDSNLSNNAF